MYDLIVIGAGPGGYEAAAYAARMGKKVALVEKERLGGTCLNTGCIPAKTFLRSSKLFHDCGEAARFGVRVGSLSFDMPGVVDRKDRVVGTLVKGVGGMLRRAGVEVIQGHARLASRSSVTVSDKMGDKIYETRNVLIATGSRPAAPPIPGIAEAHVYNSDTIFGLQQVPKKVALIGGGYIGLEFACFFNEVGAQVTVFEMLPQIAAGADREISSELLSVLQKKGIEFKLSTKVLEVGAGRILYQSKEGERMSAEADCILNATGRAPLIADLGLEEVGVDFGAKGIRTSEQGKTNVPGIWACGDVTGRRMLAHAATREGIVAVNNMFGKKDRIRYDAIPSVIYTHPEVASVGKTEEELKAAGVEYKRSVVPMAIAGRFIIENEDTSGFVKVLVGARHGQILGVHALGNLSSEFIAAAAAMVETEMCATDAEQLVFPHPTVSEALREALAGVH